MIKVERGSARREGIVQADIDELWELLTDWGNMDWWGNELEREGMKAGKAYLEGEKGKVPRTKVIERSNAQDTGVPVVSRETLIREDPVAHRLYYDATDGFILGTRNYIASWALDALEDGRCRMIITSTFDVIAPGKVEVTRDIVEAVYELIFKGLNDYLARLKSAGARKQQIS